MVGQMSIFDLMVSDMDIWEDFRDNYCKNQGAILKFNAAGKVDHKDGIGHKACCFTPNNIKEPWDNWQRCTYDNCPFLKRKRGKQMAIARCMDKDTIIRKNEQQYWEDTQEALTRIFDRCEEIDPQSGYDMLEDIQFIQGFINNHKPYTENEVEE